MKVHAAALLLGLASACARAAPVPTNDADVVASATASAPASASVAVPEAVAGGPADAEVVARISALPEVQALASPTAKLVVSVVDRAKTPCDAAFNPCPGDGEVEVLAGVDRAGEIDQRLRFFVLRATFAIEVDGGFALDAAPSPRRLTYPVWSRLDARRHRAVDIVADLPEVVAWDQFLRRHDKPDEPEFMLLWTETFAKPDCSGDAPECEFTVYVGARHAGSMERWWWFSVHPEARRIAVRGDFDRTPYDAWKATKPNGRFFDDRHPTVEFRRLEGPFPKLEEGRGDLGYGAPTKVIDDPSSWAHPAKAALADRGLVLTRVELYLGGTYPAFFVRPAAGRGTLAERAGKDPWEVRLAAHALLKGNGGFAFELVEEVPGGRSRYRYRGLGRTFERRVGSDWKML